MKHQAAVRGVEMNALVHLAPEDIDFASVPSYVPTAVDSVEEMHMDRLEPMKMRLPAEPATPAETGPLPLWERPLADVLRDDSLATVTPFPFVPRAHDANDDDLADATVAEPIPMRGEWVVPSIGVDRDELYVPPLGVFEAQGLAGGVLRAEHDDSTMDPRTELDFDEVVDAESVIDLTEDDELVIDLDDVTIDAEIVEPAIADDDDALVLDLDDITVDAEIVEPASADALLEQWSAGVSAYTQDRLEKVDGLYKRLVDAAQQPRITFGPLDLRDGTAVSGAAAEHLCPQCGALARTDIHDPIRGRIHLSCDSCFKMWQEKVESTVSIDEPFMRD
jgi:hypothetical protein